MKIHPGPVLFVVVGGLACYWEGPQEEKRA